MTARSMKLEDSLTRATDALHFPNETLGVKLFGIFTGIGYFITGFFAPIAGFLLATFAFIIIDFVIGVTAAVKRLNKKRKAGKQIEAADQIRAERIYDTVLKMLIFFLVILGTEIFRVAFMGHIEDLLSVERIPVTMLAAGVITAALFQSIRENVFEMYGLDILGFFPDKIKNLITSSKMQKSEDE